MNNVTYSMYSISNCKVSFNGVGRKPCATKMDIENLIEQGYNKAEIADFFGKTKEWCSYILKHFNLELKNLELRDEVRQKQRNEFIEQKTREMKEVIKNSGNLDEFFNTIPRNFRKILKSLKYRLKIEIENEKNDSLAETILQKIKNGSNLNQISRELNLPYCRVAKCVKNKGLADAKSERSSNRLAKIQAMVARGLTLKQIAHRFDCDVNTIYSYMGDNYKKQWFKEQKEIQLQEILKYKAKGYTNERIGEIMQVSYMTIFRILKNYNTK